MATDGERALRRVVEAVSEQVGRKYQSDVKLVTTAVRSQYEVKRCEEHAESSAGKGPTPPNNCGQAEWKRTTSLETNQ